MEQEKLVKDNLIKNFKGCLQQVELAPFLNTFFHLGQGIQNEPSEICVRQPLKIFTWSILEYFDPFILMVSLNLMFWETE